MHICKFCNKYLETSKKLLSHLSHPQSPCKTNIKDYYDKYLRKENEGYCEFCGRETSFSSLFKGYQNKYCKYCKNKSQSSKIKRKNTESKKSEELKIKNGYYNLQEVCKICNKRFKNRAGLSRHILNLHKIKPKDYYDKYLRKYYEGICPVTNKKTKFKNMTEGYFKYYGKGIANKDPNIKKKIMDIRENNKFNNPEKYEKSERQRINKYRKTCKENKELKKQRELFLLLLRKLSIDKDNKLQCQICGLKFEKERSISIHIRVHNFLVKDYYNKFFKIKENKCEICGTKTNFDTLFKGYFRYCKNCAGKSPQTIRASIKASKNYLIEKALNCQDKYDIEIININQINKVTDKIDFRCKLCNRIYRNSFYNLWLGYGKCPSCFRQSKQSGIEILLVKFIKEINKNNFTLIEGERGIIKNHETNRSLELDIYIPEKNIAIEVNGLYWHSELILKNPEKYHLNKLNETNKNNIELLQFFEDEIFFKEDIVKSIIRNKLGLNKNRIYARNCKIKEIDPKTKNNFLNNNHIQGEDKCSIKLGAFYNDELVSVMTFGHGSISRKRLQSNLDWELSRFSVKKDTSVIGIASKLLTYFKRNYNWENIYSFADLRISNFGDLYYKLGFEFLYQTKPDYFYIDGIKRIHRFNLRKTEEEKKTGLTEKELRHSQGYYKIWDCGKLKYLLKK